VPQAVKTQTKRWKINGLDYT